MKRLMFSLCMMTLVSLLVSCTDSKTSNVITIDDGVTITQTDAPIQSIGTKDYEKKQEVKGDNYNSSSVIFNDKVINIAKDGKSLRTTTSDGKTDNIDVQNSDFYIRKHMRNGDYIVWIEANGQINEPHNTTEEYIYYRNLKTGEINLLDELEYISDNFDISQKEVKDISLSDKNKIVYRKYSVNDENNIQEELVLYDLSSKKCEIIASSDSKSRTFLSPSIGGNDVIYLENNLDEEGRVKEQNLYFNNIKTANSNSIKTGLEIIDLEVYGKYAGMISKRKEGEKIHTEFQVYDIATSHVTSRIFEGSNAYKYIKKIDGEKFIESINLDIDDKYIYMLGNISLIYDLNNKKFITLGDKDIHSSKIGDRQILVSNYKTGKSELYQLKE